MSMTEHDPKIDDEIIARLEAQIQEHVDQIDRHRRVTRDRVAGGREAQQAIIAVAEVLRNTAAAAGASIEAFSDAVRQLAGSMRQPLTEVADLINRVAQSQTEGERERVIAHQGRQWMIGEHVMRRRAEQITDQVTHQLLYGDGEAEQPEGVMMARGESGRVSVGGVEVGQVTNWSMSSDGGQTRRERRVPPIVSMAIEAGIDPSELADRLTDEGLREFMQMFREHTDEAAKLPAPPSSATIEIADTTKTRQFDIQD